MRIMLWNIRVHILRSLGPRGTEIVLILFSRITLNYDSFLPRLLGSTSEIRTRYDSNALRISRRREHKNRYVPR